jgi:long-chain fatty acid transport protein
MSGIRTSTKALVVAASALAMGAATAQAGGLAVHEQSTSAQGSSWAGSAAGYDLSSGFWNPAAFGIAGWGFTTESHAALLIPDASLSNTSALAFTPGAVTPSGASSTDIGHIALIPASYAAYRINKDLVLGLSINSPFGLATKPEDVNWQGRFVGTSSKMFTANATPTLSYQVVPGVLVGAGLQLEYMSLKFKFGFPGNPFTDTGTAIADIKDDVSIGFTAGVLLQPSKSTSIGLGFRSSISHKMDGSLSLPPGGGGTVLPISATFENPEIVTLSIRQAIAPHTRLLGTIEWTNWSRFGVIPINGTATLGNLKLPGNWHDGWLYSAGLEYDVNKMLTVRTGVAFEKSPIQNASERLIQVPDSDRWWVSGGATYKYSEKLSFDFAYTHIFFDDAPFDRTSLTGGSHITGKADQSADIVSLSIKNKW